MSIAYNPATKAVVCAAYGGISLKTLKAWIEPFEDEIGEYLGRSYKPSQVELMVKHFGFPKAPSLLICKVEELQITKTKPLPESSKKGKKGK